MYGFVEGQENVWSPMFAGITARSKSDFMTNYYSAHRIILLSGEKTIGFISNLYHFRILLTSSQKFS